jgi:hypothetical protein
VYFGSLQSGTADAVGAGSALGLGGDAEGCAPCARCVCAASGIDRGSAETSTLAVVAESVGAADIVLALTAATAVADDDGTVAEASGG